MGLQSWTRLNNFHFHSACKFSKQGDKYTALTSSFLIWNHPVVPCLVLTVASWNCIQVSQEADKVVWYSHLFKSFPQFVVIHTVKGFHVVSETDASLEFPCFLYDPTNVGSLTSGSSAFSKPSLYIWKFLVCVILKPAHKILSMNLLAWEMSAIVPMVWNIL